MVKVENYPNAYKEVYIILKSMREEERKLIPKSFMKMIEENMNDEYDFKLDEDKDFQNQDILRETRTILAYIFINFWATNEQKERIEKKFRQDIISFENSKTNYNNKELFKKKEMAEIKETNIEEQSSQLIEIKKEGFIKKLFNIIKRLFKR